MIRPDRVNDESGAALIIALVFVTVVGLLSAVLLTFADTSIRATKGLREQTMESYAAEAAGQLAVNSLRNSTLTNSTASDCANSSITFPSSLPGPTTAGASTLVTCEREPSSSDAQKPLVATIKTISALKDALVTMGRSAAESGIFMTAANSTDVLNVEGGIASNSSIKVAAGKLTSDSRVTAVGSCTGDIEARVKTCSGPSQELPVYDPPPAVMTPQSVPACDSKGGLVTFTPGLYTNATALTACAASNVTMWFRPGAYYFNFPSTSPRWTMDAGALVGGTPTGDIVSSAPVIPGSCVSPLTATPPAANGGVQFVFAGPSQWVVGGGAQVELCGSASSTGPPIAIYGLKEAVSGPKSATGGAIPAENGCVTTIAGGCPFLSSTSASTDQSSLYVQGTVYAPTALLALSAASQGDHQSNMHFNAGMVVRSLSVSLEGPVPPPNLPEVVVLLHVYVCPDVSPCTADQGRVRLRARVGISNPTKGSVIAGARSVRVYSWAAQR